MGVPAFYRWLVTKYPKILLPDIEKGNNKVEYDNLYIDMNGLIHPCSHPEDHEPPASVTEMYENIVKYVDRLFDAIAPRRLLFLSIDGVAPRAKMNQQRARRYRAAQDKKETERLTAAAISDLYPGVIFPPSRSWDSNVITPGTEFMDALSFFIRDYITLRMSTDDRWKQIKVIFSDSSVCGEGEHKIMNFIRSQRAQVGYDPNQHHVVHGLDADLIMLALATHEPNFSILREEQLSYMDKAWGKGRKGKRSGSAGNLKDEVSPSSSDDWIKARKLECLQIPVLRQYLQAEFEFLRDSLQDRFNLENIYDDVVFLCYLVGNDFLPHTPTLNIREGGIDLLLNVYKDLMPSSESYVTSSNESGQRVVHLPTVEY